MLGTLGPPPGAAFGAAVDPKLPPGRFGGSRQIQKAPEGISKRFGPHFRGARSSKRDPARFRKLQKGSRQIRLLHFPATDPPKGWGFRALNQPTRMLDSNWGPGPPKMAKAGFRKFPGPLSAPPWIPKAPFEGITGGYLSGGYKPPLRRTAICSGRFCLEPPWIPKVHFWRSWNPSGRLRQWWSGTFPRRVPPKAFGRM